MPSTATVMADPMASFLRPSRNCSEGFLTSRIPDSSISKMPISLQEPKRFLEDLRNLSCWKRSPSSCKTVSTRCSRTRGPARLPSLVTWPIRKIEVLELFASSIILSVQ